MQEFFWFRHFHAIKKNLSSIVKHSKFFLNDEYYCKYSGNNNSQAINLVSLYRVAVTWKYYNKEKLVLMKFSLYDYIFIAEDRDERDTWI